MIAGRTPPLVEATESWGIASGHIGIHSTLRRVVYWNTVEMDRVGGGMGSSANKLTLGRIDRQAPDLKPRLQVKYNLLLAEQLYLTTIPVPMRSHGEHWGNWICAESWWSDLIQLIDITKVPWKPYIPYLRWVMVERFQAIYGKPRLYTILGLSKSVIAASESMIRKYRM